VGRIGGFADNWADNEELVDPPDLVGPARDLERGGWRLLALGVRVAAVTLDVSYSRQT
jgi:hypothetical protein